MADFFTANQLVAHAIGDYVIQSDWMASEKTKRSIAAAIHAISYAIPFLLLRPSLLAMVVIVSTHFVIDRWRLARFVVLLKNTTFAPTTQFDGPRHQDDYDLSTGSPRERPAFLSVWLLIIVDNVLHVLINAAALRWL